MNTSPRYSSSRQYGVWARAMTSYVNKHGGVVNDLTSGLICKLAWYAYYLDWSNRDANYVDWYV